eukprot:maker-scaffold262_size232883-snap-gene-1.10 protein:Tk12539 transcript:maker-scaffold262_size232883-snap-gene-1.10-mRNA-1 annotation:"putative oxidoreductase"
MTFVANGFGICVQTRQPSSIYPGRFGSRLILQFLLKPRHPSLGTFLQSNQEPRSVQEDPTPAQVFIPRNEDCVQSRIKIRSGNWKRILGKVCHLPSGRESGLTERSERTSS